MALKGAFGHNLNAPFHRMRGNDFAQFSHNGARPYLAARLRVHLYPRGASTCRSRLTFTREPGARLIIAFPPPVRHPLPRDATSVKGLRRNADNVRELHMLGHREEQAELVPSVLRRTGRRRRQLLYRFKAACVRAGIPDFHYHDLRHTFATRLRAAGVHEYDIADLLGHSTTRGRRAGHLLRAATPTPYLAGLGRRWDCSAPRTWSSSGGGRGARKECSAIRPPSGKKEGQDWALPAAVSD